MFRSESFKPTVADTIITLGHDGTWQVHRQRPGYEETETICGHGWTRFPLRDIGYDTTDLEVTAATVCPWCWTKDEATPEERAEIAARF